MGMITINDWSVPYMVRTYSIRTGRVSRVLNTHDTITVRMSNGQTIIIDKSKSDGWQQLIDWYERLDKF